MTKFLKDQTNYDIIESLLKEIAKASNEIKCAEGDIKKAQGRIGFALMLINMLHDRESENMYIDQPTKGD
jgi:hypothetical protein